MAISQIPNGNVTRPVAIKATEKRGKSYSTRARVEAPYTTSKKSAGRSVVLFRKSRLSREYPRCRWLLYRQKMKASVAAENVTVAITRCRKFNFGPKVSIIYIGQKFDEDMVVTGCRNKAMLRLRRADL